MIVSVRRKDASSPPRSKARRGTTAVEAAVVIPVFFIFFFGLVQIGRGFMCCHLLANAARAGCRHGILEGTDNNGIAAVVDGILAKQGISGYTPTVHVNGNQADASTAVATDEIAVSISVPVSKITWLPGAQSLKGNLTGQFTLRRE